MVGEEINKMIIKLSDKNELINNLDKLKTTLNGALRIRKNLGISTTNVVDWCKTQIKAKGSSVKREGKNFYVRANGYIITINSSSFTIITAHVL